MTNLPTTTPAEIAALPDGEYLSELGEVLFKRGECWLMLDIDPDNPYSHRTEIIGGYPPSGITARLVDPAPLEAVANDLRKAAAKHKPNLYADDSEKMEMRAWKDALTLAAQRIEAALNTEKNDG